MCNYISLKDAIFAFPGNFTKCDNVSCTSVETSRSHNGFHAELDLSGAASSGYGHCPEGIPVEFALLSILAAFGVAFGLLYRTLTLVTMGGRKRQFEPGFFTFASFAEETADFIWAGMTAWVVYFLLSIE